MYLFCRNIKYCFIDKYLFPKNIPILIFINFILIYKLLIAFMIMHREDYRIHDTE